MAGTAGDSETGDARWVDTDSDLELLISNALLCEEILPSQLIPVLLTEERRALRESVTQIVEADAELTDSVRERLLEEHEGDEDAAAEAFDDALALARAREIARRLDEAWPLKVGEFITFPLTLHQSIPRRFPLPTVEAMLSEDFDMSDVEPPEEPNVHIRSVTLAIVPSVGEHALVRLTLDLTGSTDEYSFRGSFPIDLTFSHREGRASDSAVAHHHRRLTWIWLQATSWVPSLGSWWRPFPGSFSDSLPVR